MAGHYLFDQTLFYYDLEHNSILIPGTSGNPTVVPVREKRQKDGPFLLDDGRFGNRPEILRATAGGVPAGVPFRVREWPSRRIRRFAFHCAVRPVVSVQAGGQVASPHP